MKKILFLCLLLAIFLPTTYAQNIDFLAKKSSAGDETYSQFLEDISLNSPITFQVTTLGNTINQNFNINFGTGFIFEGYSVSGNCNFSLQGATANNFVYNFSGSNLCLSQVQFIYKPIGVGTKEIHLIHENSISKTIEIQISSHNSIIKAQTKDSNQNGYIDGYDVEFAFGISDTNDIGSLTIGGFPAISYVGNSQTGTILFTDNIFSSGDIPQILSSGNIFGNIGIVGNNSIIEEDNAGAVLKKVNHLNATGTLYIQSGSIDFEFSEYLHPNSHSFFQIKKDTTVVNGSFTLTGNVLQFQPNITLGVGNYSFESLTGAKDYSSNANRIVGFPKTLILTGNILGNCTGLPSNAQWNSVSSIFQYWNGSTFTPASLAGAYNTSASATECRFTCKTNYTWNGSSCISSNSGGGGGGGEITTCTDSMLECRSYLGGFVYFRKSGTNCTGGNLAKTCSLTNTSSGTTSQSGTTETGEQTQTESNSGDGGNTLTFTDIEKLKEYLLSSTKNQKIIAIINQMYNEILLVRSDLYMKISPIWRENYYNLLASYRLYITALNNYTISRNLSDFSNITPTYNAYKNYLEFLKAPENIYITKVWKNGYLIFETKNEKIKPILAKIEIILFKKYTSLLTRKKISQEVYNNTIANYNNFILYLTIFRETKNKQAREKGKFFMNEIIKIYSIK